MARRKFRGRRRGVRSSIDTSRLSAAASRAGIDPRRWLYTARVLDVAIDEEQGIFADVQDVVEGDIETCFVGAAYAGDGFGSFVPPAIGDLVLVANPNGDPAAGGVIIARIWHGTAKPSVDFKSLTPVEPEDAQNEPVTVVEPGKTMRVIAKAGATIRLEVDGSGKVEIAATGAAQIEVTGENAITVNSPDVRLGDSPGNPVARVGDLVGGVSAPMQVQVIGGSSAGIFPVTVAPAGTGIASVGQITSGKTTVKA